jgi:hypothetical protein
MAGIHERYERLLEAGLALAADLSLPATLQRIIEHAVEELDRVIRDLRSSTLGAWISP